MFTPTQYAHTERLTLKLDNQHVWRLKEFVPTIGKPKCSMLRECELDAVPDTRVGTEEFCQRITRSQITRIRPDNKCREEQSAFSTEGEV